MWLFDNIFLDEDAVAETATAVAEKPEDAAVAEQAPVTPQGESESFDELMWAQAAPQWEEVTIAPAAEATTGTMEATPESASTESSGVSFDIGGDLNFGGIESTPETPAVVEPTAEVAVETPAVVEPTSFTVNGVTYNADGTPASGADASSIAMIQGSTAATGINIIDEAAPAVAIEGKEEAIVESSIAETTQTESAPESNSLMDMISFGDEDTVSTEPVVAETTQTVEAPVQIPEIETPTIPEASITPAISDFSLVDPIGTMTEDVTPILEDIPAITEPVVVAPEPVAAISTESKVEDVSSSTSDLTTILNGFIKELNEREEEISKIIMKRHELARRRTEIEDDYKTRILALNMEDEFLKSKAERERSEQDKLQHVIKNFQKQIAMSE